MIRVRHIFMLFCLCTFSIAYYPVRAMEVETIKVLNQNDIDQKVQAIITALESGLDVNQVFNNLENEYIALKLSGKSVRKISSSLRAKSSGLVREFLICDLCDRLLNLSTEFGYPLK